jgi:sialidase-1
MASLIAIEPPGGAAGPWLLFSNPAVDSPPRRHTTVRLSTDHGQTWPENAAALLDEGVSAGYSSLTMIDPQTIGILYEGSRSHLTFQRIPMRDLTGGAGSQPASPVPSR